MRTAVAGTKVKVRAIAGTYTVLLALEVETSARAELLGFAFRREEVGAEEEVKWLKATKVFEAIEPNPPPRRRYSTLEHPIQSLLWGDYTAHPGRTYRYVVRPVYGKPGALRYGSDVELQVKTEPEMGDGDMHGVWFNLGAVASQAYADRYENEPPPEPDNPNHDQTKWLSRGLLDACLRFINETPKGDGLRVAAYEFNYKPVLLALKAASARGVNVQIIYEAGKEKVKGVLVETSATKANKKSIADADFTQKTKLIKRTKRAKIPHNKFIVRLKKNTKPVMVWTGSTNFTESGFLGQTNVGHVVVDDDVAAQYAAYWKLLSDDPTADELEPKLESLTPDPADQLAKKSTTCIFSPRTSSQMLKWYAERVKEATGAVMYTGGFGVTEILAPAFAEDRDFLRFLLLEKPPTKAAAKLLGDDRDLVVIYGNVLGEIWKANAKGELTLRRPIPGFELERWFLHEELFRKVGHIFFVHTKILMVDPLSDDPLIFTGSANFSPPSLTSNDENMLLIRGDKRVADIYMTEIDRIMRHFYFRDIAAELHGKDDKKAKFLEPDNSWLKPYYKEGTLKDRRRRMFFG